MMRIKRYIKILPLLGILFCSFSSQLDAEKLQRRIAQGNNVALGFHTGFSAPLLRSWSGTLQQIPKGSSNTFGHDGANLCLATARDLDGDGVAEDTMYLHNGRDNQGFRADLEYYDVIADLYAQGLNVGAEMNNIRHQRIWSTIDPEDLVDWPAGGREGRNPGGEIISRGSETIFSTASDVWMDWNGVPSGYNQEWTCHFLNFAENKDMVYMHIRIQNVTEYTKFNPAGEYSAVGQTLPDGWDWDGVVIYYHTRAFSFGGNLLGGAVFSKMGWAYHPEKEIYAHYFKDPTLPGFIPESPPVWGLKALRRPSFKGETAELTNVHANSWGEFGASGATALVHGAYSNGQVYRGVLGIEESIVPGMMNPFTGKQPTYGFPGALDPSDARYNQWIWGGNPGYWVTTGWGELHNVAPRDTFSFDFAYMFAPAGVIPLELPPFDVSEIDNPMMQDYFAPMEHYTDVAEATFAGDLRGPETPRPPALTIVPGDRQVTITWSDVNVDAKDAYYTFLVENGFDTGNYREQDFEGFRLYRSFVGPSSSHEDFLGDFNTTNSSLQFHYIDKLEDDRIFNRMRNGMRVWYALEVYDRNFDPISGEEFSLPEAGSGKTWNRVGEDIYNVVPRSNASNYRPAEVTSVTYIPPSANSATPVSVASVTLNGDGALLTQDPVYIEPEMDAELVLVIHEKITQDVAVFLTVTGSGPHGYRAGKRYIALTDASGNILGDNASFLSVRTGEGRPGRGGFGKLITAGGMSADGAAYSVSAEIDNERDGNVQTQIDAGGYSGADVGFSDDRNDWDAMGEAVYHGQDIYQGLMQTGAYTIAWKSAAGSVTLEVTDRTHGRVLPFSPYIDGDGWGFMPPGVAPSTYPAEFGIDWGGRFPDNTLTPRSERSTLLVESLPVDNNEAFHLWINGQVIHFAGDEITMPSSNTVMELITAFGNWDGTEFTQTPDVIWPGEQWKFEIKAMTLNDEDIDLSKVKVVPNPYIASSFLDMSPGDRRIEFVNLPDRCTVRIYTLSGNLVNVLNHIGASRQGWSSYTDWDRLTDSQPRELSGYDNHGGTEPWNLKNRFGQTVASGLYFYHVTDVRGKNYTGKFYVVN